MRASTASRTVAGSASAPDASNSVTKNAFPRVSAWIASPSAACEDASSRTASKESGGNLHPLDRGHRRELAEQAAQQVSIDRLVITVRGDDERGGSADATTEDAQHVERRLVTPMHILEHDHHRLAQLLQQRQRHLARVPAGLDIQREPTADLHSDIEVPPERRHGQLLAGAEQNAPLNPRDEGAHERRLAHARLATDEQNRPPSRRASSSRANSASRSISRDTGPSLRTTAPPSASQAVRLSRAILKPPFPAGTSRRSTTAS